MQNTRKHYTVTNLIQPKTKGNSMNKFILILVMTISSVGLISTISAKEINSIDEILELTKIQEEKRLFDLFMQEQQKFNANYQASAEEVEQQIELMKHNLEMGFQACLKEQPEIVCTSLKTHLLTNT